MYLKSLLRFAGLAGTLLMSGAPGAAELSQLQLERRQNEDVVRVYVSAQVPLSVSVLTNPDRVVADFEQLTIAAGVSLTLEAGRWMHSVRKGVQSDGRLRLVFDLIAPANMDMQFERGEQGGAYAFRIFAAGGSGAGAEPVSRQHGSETAATGRTDPVAQPAPGDRRFAAEADADALVRRQLNRMETGRESGQPGGSAPPEALAPEQVESVGWRTLPPPPGLVPDPDANNANERGGSADGYGSDRPES